MVSEDGQQRLDVPVLHLGGVRDMAVTVVEAVVEAIVEEAFAIACSSVVVSNSSSSSSSNSTKRVGCPH